MLGTNEDQRFMGPAGSQTHPTQSHHQIQQPFKTIQLTFPSHTTPPSFPFLPPFTNFPHLSAFHTTSYSGRTTIDPDIIFNRANVHTSNFLPGSSKFTPSTSNQLENLSSSAAIGGRLSFFDFHSNSEGEFYL